MCEIKKQLRVFILIIQVDLSWTTWAHIKIFSIDILLVFREDFRAESGFINSLSDVWKWTNSEGVETLALIF